MLGQLELEYTDGTQETVDASAVQRSGFLQEVLAPNSGEELTLPTAQKQSFASWLQFLKLQDKHGTTNSCLLNYLQERFGET